MRSHPHYTIIAPLVPDLDIPKDEAGAHYSIGAGEDFYGIVPVTTCSPLLARKAVYQCALQFRREKGYDFTQYDERDEEDSARAYVWCDDFYGEDRFSSVFGACCFRSRADGWGLQWVWMHPYARREGHLSRAWPFFVRRFPRFHVEWPLSESMILFLEKHGGCPCGCFQQLIDGSYPESLGRVL